MSFCTLNIRPLHYAMGAVAVQRSWKINYILLETWHNTMHWWRQTSGISETWLSFLCNQNLHFCEIKIFIFVRSKFSFLWDQNLHFCEIKIWCTDRTKWYYIESDFSWIRQYPHVPWPKQQYPYSTMHYGSIRCIKDFQDYKKLRLQFGSSLIKTVWDRLKIAQIFREKYLSKIW